MSKSFMRVNTWPQGAPERRPVEDDWKAVVAEELAEDDVAQVFLLENEWDDIEGGSGHEVVSAHLTEPDALGALHRQATDLGVEIEEGDYSFNVHPDDDDVSDIYYVSRYEVENV